MYETAFVYRINACAWRFVAFVLSLLFGGSLHLFCALSLLFSTSLHLFPASLHLFLVSLHLFPASLHLFAASSHLFFTSLRSEEHTSELQSRFDFVCRL